MAQPKSVRRYSPFRHLPAVLRRRLLHLTVFLTRRCNQRCPFCFYLAAAQPLGRKPAENEPLPAGPPPAPPTISNDPAGISTSSSDLRQPELSLAELERLAAGCPPLLWLAFSGGEIFLREDLAEITTRFYHHTRPAIILLPSNGFATGRIVPAVEEILACCPQSTVVVKLSLDGPPAVHDALRGVAGAHAACLETARQLGPLLERHAHFELGINSVFGPATQESMIQTIDFVATLPHIRTHTLSLARGDLADPGQLATDLEQYRQACQYLAEKLRRRQAATYRFGGARLKAAQDILQRRYILETARRQQPQLPCLAGRLNLVVTDDGTVYPCENFAPRMVMGNLRQADGDLAALLQTEQARRVVAAIGRERCFCTHECYMMTNILFSPRTWPALLKEYFLLNG